jgi:hypothetical protein
MTRLRISPGVDQNPSGSHERHLSDLLAGHDLSAREVARRSAIIAEELGNAKLKFGHQAVSSWLKGERHPSANHKQALAMILGISVADLTRALDAEIQSSNQFTTRFATVVVPGEFQTYRYILPIKNDIDIAQPAIYRDWSSMFSFPPTRLMRHLRNLHYDAFGWIPDNSASPMVHHPRCLVPLERVPPRNVLQKLDSAESSQRRVWFVYLPGGQLHVGIGYRNKRCFAFARNDANRIVTQEFPLSRIDLVGYFTGNVVFHLQAADMMQGTGGRGQLLVTPPGVLNCSNSEDMSQNLSS